jgi:hypothetical protein
MSSGAARTLCIVTVVALAARSIAAGDRWIATFEASGANPRAIAASCEGGFAVSDYNMDAGATIIRFDPSGNKLWHTQLHDLATGFEAIAPLPGGRLVAAGSGSSPAIISVFDDRGVEVYKRGLNGVPFFRGIAPTSDGGFVATGTSARIGTGIDIWVVRFNPSWTVQWVRILSGPLDEIFGGVAEALDGGYWISGRTNSSGAGGTDLFVSRLDPSGAVVWTSTYGGTGAETGGAIVPTLDGGVFLQGTTASFGAGGNDAWVLRLDPDGDVEWQRAIGGTGNESSVRSSPAGDGGLFVACGTNSFNGTGSPSDFDLLAARFAADGTPAWSRAYGTAGSEGLLGLAPDREGGFVALGGSTAPFLLRIPGDDGAIPGCSFDRTAVPTLTTTSVSPSSATFTSTITTEFIEGTPGAVPTASVIPAAIVCASGLPGEVSPTGAPQPLRFLDHDTLVWEDGLRSGAAEFNVYRGSLSALAAGDTGACLVAGLTSATWTDGDVPAPAEGRFYLVTGSNAGGEGSAGFRAVCQPRALSASCAP